MRTTLIGRILVVVAVLILQTERPADAIGAVPDTAITVSGCVERDAASRTPIFKLVVALPDDSTRLYRLGAPPTIDLAAAVGKTGAATGVPSVEKRGGREYHVLTVKAFKVVADRCK
jgi:hypothetical protein